MDLSGFLEEVPGAVVPSEGDLGRSGPVATFAEGPGGQNQGQVARRPLAQGLGLGQLRGGKLLGDVVAIAVGELAVVGFLGLVRGQGIEDIGVDQIARHAGAVVIEHAQIIQGAARPLAGRGLVPGDRLGDIGVDAEALLIEVSQRGLGIGIALFGGGAVPARGRRQVLLDPATALIHDAEIVLGHFEALLGGLLVPLHRLARIFLHPFAHVVHIADHVEGGGMALGGGPQEPFHGRIEAALLAPRTVMEDEAVVVFGLRIPVIGALAVPAQRLALILADAIAVEIEIAQIRHGSGKALVGAALIPEGGLLVVLVEAEAIGIHLAQETLSLGIARLGQGLELGQGRLVVASVIGLVRGGKIRPGRRREGDQQQR